MSTAATSPSPDVVGGRWPELGRGPLLASVRTALGGRGAVLVGPAGVGKTTLAEQAVPRPAGRLVGAPGTRDHPLWAVRLLAPDAATIDDAATDAAALLHKAHRGAGAPVLRVDDIDDLDDASAAVVARLALTRAARVVATRRPGPAPDAVASLWREAGLRRIDVPALDEDDTSTLVRDALGGLLDGRADAAIWAVSGGNPQVIRDVVAASVEAGTLGCTEGFWRLVGDLKVGGTTSERVAGLLGELDDDERDGLEVLALAGPVPLPLAEAMVPAPILEALERRGHLCVDAGAGAPAAWLADPAVQVVVTSGLPALGRRRLAERAAAAFDSVAPGAPGPELALRAAVWRLDAGRAFDADELVAAARLAVDLRDIVLGERLAGAAVAAGAGAEAVLLQSWCADEHGNTEGSTAALASYEPRSDAERVALAVRSAEQHHWIRRDREVAAAILREASAATDEPWALAPVASGAVFTVLDGRPADALATAEPLLDHPEPLVGSTAALAATIALAMLDRPVDAQEVAEQAMAGLADASHSLFIDPGVHIIGLLFALQGQGRLAEADQLVTDVYRHTLTRPGHQAQGWSAMLRAYILLARGLPAAAAEAAQEAELVWDSAKLQGTARWSATIAALALGEQGDLDGVEQALRRVDARDPGGFELFAPEVHRARAWRALCAGEDPVPELQAAAELALERGLATLAAGAAHDLIRIGEPAKALAVLDRTAGASAVTEARRSLGAAALADDPAGLIRSAEAFASFGAAGWAIEARALAAAADPARAGALLADVRALAGAGGLATPPLTSLSVDPVAVRASVLTSREEEVARLAASGLANREIAERLVVSLRTVENHLHRAFAKLGVTTRGELADHVAPIR
jgi:DNA-binding CsgD family transcriptional regulator